MHQKNLAFSHTVWYQFGNIIEWQLKKTKKLNQSSVGRKARSFFKNSKNFKEKKLVLVLFPKTIYLQLLETYERRCTYFTCFKPGIWMKHFFYIRNETKD